MEKSGTDRRLQEKAAQALHARAVQVYYRSLTMSRDAFEAMEKARVACKDSKGRELVEKMPDPSSGMFSGDFQARMRPFTAACKARNIDL